MNELMDANGSIGEGAGSVEPKSQEGAHQREIPGEALVGEEAWEIAEEEPWGEPVEGAKLLDELAAVVRRFVVLPEWGVETVALWVLHTYAFELRDVGVYLGIELPEKRCGKTTLLTVLRGRR